MRRRADLSGDYDEPISPNATVADRDRSLLFIPLLKPNGVLVYSTCSLEPEENEEAFVDPRANASLSLETERSLLPFSDGF